MQMEEFKPNVTVKGPLFPEPVQVIVVLLMGAPVKLTKNALRELGLDEHVDED